MEMHPMCSSQADCSLQRRFFENNYFVTSQEIIIIIILEEGAGCQLRFSPKENPLPMTSWGEMQNQKFDLSWTPHDVACSAAP